MVFALCFRPWTHTSDVVTSKYQLSLDLASDSYVSFLATERGCRARRGYRTPPGPTFKARIRINEKVSSVENVDVGLHLGFICPNTCNSVLAPSSNRDSKVQRSVQGSCENPHDFRWVLVFLVRLGWSACVV